MVASYPDRQLLSYKLKSTFVTIQRHGNYGTNQNELWAINFFNHDMAYSQNNKSCLNSLKITDILILK